MKEELQQKLWDNYPEIFPKHESGWCISFECNDGWYNHINALCATIMLFCKDHGDTVPVVTQVKEKYGTLRFYVMYASIEMYDLIERFEQESQYICEVCGDRGKVRNEGGWYTCLCDRHLAERRNNVHNGRNYD